MSAPGEGTSGDLIGEYLDRLRAGLRVAPDEAELILAEAEDHLRETAAAGLAVGMTEREAQEAAISIFGPVPAVVHAHQVRRGRVAAVAGDAAAATWKLASLLVIATGIGGLAAATSSTIHPMPRPIVIHSMHYPPAHFILAVAVAVGGAILLTGYNLVRRRQQRRGRLRGPLVGGAFPAVAAGFFCAVVLALLAISWSGPGAPSYPGLFIVVYLAMAIGYAAQAARTLRRRGRRRRVSAS
jgi:hypothetical protein